MAAISNIGKAVGGAAMKIGKTKTGKVAGVAALLGIGAAQADPVDHTINAGFDAMFGTPDIDNMILGTDLRFRNFIPSIGPIPTSPPVPFLGQEARNAIEVLRPKDRPASFMSGRHLNTAPFRLSQVNKEQIDNITVNAAEYPFGPEGTPRGYSQVPGSTFPQRMTSRQWDSATGDVVLGAYNLRRG